MEYVRKISNLTSFLHATNRTSNSISRFLVLDTFSVFAPTALILGLLQSDGSIMISGSFGINEDFQNEILPFASGINNPFSQAIQKDKIIEIGRIETLSAISRKGEKTGHSLKGFKYSIAWPIYYVGAGILYFEKKVTLHPLDELFFHAVGGMLALHLTRSTNLSDFDHFQNIAGPAGPQGIKGEPGPAGPAGPAGATGVEGATGATGATGVAGAKGATGAKGSAGVKGDTGLQGLAGLEKNRRAPSTESTELTSRQLVILAELRNGKTNSTIANDLDYSESLIRQETIEIYRKMGVTGRKALMENDDSSEDKIS